MFGLVLAAGNAVAECAPLRLGYVDQHRPPYFMGSGTAEATPAGAGVDMIREVAAIAGCKVIAVRLPPARLLSALRAGTIDVMSLEAVESDKELYALPLDAAGKLDVGKTLRAHAVMFVRASDTALRNIDPAREFGQRWVGSNYASPLAAALRKYGFRVDDGARDTERNFEKLIHNRIDGYAVSVTALTDMDAWVAAKYGNAVVRLERPIQTNNIWLAVNKDYYARNPAQVTAMWDWVEEHGRQRFAKIVRKYEKNL